MHRTVLVAPIVSAALFGCVLVAATATRHQNRAPDFDGDGVADVAIWRPVSDYTPGTFYAILSGSGYTQTSRLEASIGSPGDIPVVADYDGDGKTDIAVFRPFQNCTWTIRLSSQNYATPTTIQWGLDQDVPVPGDYDGDGKTDIAVYRAWDKNWYILQGARDFTTAFVVSWGVPGGTPVPADYDGDGKLDIAFYYSNADGDGKGAFFVLQGSTFFKSAFKAKVPLTSDGTQPVPADFDGDGKVDITIYDPTTLTFTVRYAATNYATGLDKVFGAAGDVPVPADFDGDGKADFAVFRPTAGTYYILTSSSGYTTQTSAAVAGGSSGLDKAALSR